MVKSNIKKFSSKKYRKSINNKLTKKYNKIQKGGTLTKEEQNILYNFYYIQNAYCDILKNNSGDANECFKIFSDTKYITVMDELRHSLYARPKPASNINKANNVKLKGNLFFNSYFNTYVFNNNLFDEPMGKIILEFLVKKYDSVKNENLKHEISVAKGSINLPRRSTRKV